MSNRGRVRTEQGQKRVRAYLNGVLVADTTNVLLVWEKPYYPAFYIPASDVRTDLVIATGATTRTPSRGTAQLHSVKVDGADAVDAAAWFTDSPIEELNDHIHITWGAMTSWFEEDEEVYVHPRSPYARVDVLPSSRHIRVEVDGVTLADSTNTRILFETGLPPRYYIPKTDVRMDLLEESDLNTACPYKGTASYYHIRGEDGLKENLVWWYPSPLEESARVAGYVSFYNEKVDIYIDGEPEGRPKTMFS
jgi:uncharacterized protein (DUF427 family)